MLVNGVIGTGELKKLGLLHNFAHITGQSRINSICDMGTMLDKKVLQKTAFSRCKFAPQVLQFAVEFILNKDHVATVSWGFKDINLSKNETLVFPRLPQRLTRMVLYQKYKKK